MICKLGLQLVIKHGSQFLQSQRCSLHFSFHGTGRIKNAKLIAYGDQILNSRRFFSQDRCLSSNRLDMEDETHLDFSLRAKQHKAAGLPIVHHDKYVCEFPLKHRFSMRKFHAVLRHLRIDNVISVKQIVKPRQISVEECGLVHNPDYIHKFFNGLTSKEEQRLTGFQWSPGIVSRCRYETGGTLQACHLAMERGVACSTGGGTHHAFADYGSGYCLINDMAVAAACMIRDTDVQRVLIFDLDVHQGDGTASIMQGSQSVYTVSVHCQSNFPFNKQISHLDLGLKDHVEDKEYLREIQDLLDEVLEVFDPNLVIYDAGVDPHKDDALGRLDLTDQGLFDRDHYVIDFFVKQGIPIATVIGGGYCSSVSVLGKRHSIVHRAATKIWTERQL